MDHSIRDPGYVRKSGTTSAVPWLASPVRRVAAAALARAVLVLSSALVTSGCDEFHLSTQNLEVAPNPARPGETVVASVFVEVIPVQRYTVTLFIDGQEQLSTTAEESPAAPLVLELGDAADLIQAYGVGQHTVYVEVRAEDRSSRTADYLFELRQTGT